MEKNQNKTSATSSTPTTSSIYSSPTTTTKYPNPTHGNPPFPNIAFSPTHLNPKTLSRSHSVTRETTPPTSSKHSAKSVSNEVRRAFNGFYFCADVMQSPNIEHHLKNTLNPLITLKIVNHKDITNPYLFRGALMVTTFVHSAGNRTNEFWRFIEEASRTNITLAESELPSLNKMLSQCKGRVPIHVL